MNKVLVSDLLSQQGLDVLTESGDFEVDVLLDLSHEELLDRIADYNALLIRSATKVTADVIDAATQLRVIGRAGVGVDNIDVQAATRNGILVVNTPTGNTIAAAEHTIAMLLALARNIVPAGISLRNKTWQRNEFIGVELYGKSFGTIGLGRIGREVTRRVQAFGMQVIAYDPYISASAAEKIGIRLVDRETLFQESDYISIHTHLNAETYHSIGASEFARMKPSCRLINCARGGIIDEDALYDALKAGELAGAALDVFENEPATDTPLLDLENVLALPHLGASTSEAQEHVAIEVAQQVKNALRGEPVANAVNQPKIDPRTLDILGPYLTLAEKIGSFHAQIVEGQISAIKIHYNGTLFQKEDVTPVTVALQKGLLTPVLADVNYVNAPFLIKQRGISVTETKSESEANFANSIAITVVTDKGESVIEGTAFGKKDIRIVRINQLHINVRPTGYILLIYNSDQPGMIGLMGTILGEHNINIADMTVGRSRVWDLAVTLINVDSPVPRHVLQTIASQKKIDFVKQVFLPGQEDEIEDFANDTMEARG
ncbi:MAG: phosphoglycerate dehydrogenase [Candidatus Poribacteria bacterium]|nr:phosphoglycerate dehydrogenase [Candidatus Poribacteria bacterium]